MTTPYITIHPTQHATDIITTVGRTCPTCRRLTWWWRNQGGSSVCIDCAVATEGEDAL